MNERHNKNKAFTLIELLTVVAIIAMLISIFGIGLRKVKIIQRNLQQKAAFHCTARILGITRTRP